MFKRRNPLTTLQNLKNLLWPKAGWIRAIQYYACRIKRLPGSPHAIAAGFAFGAAISFTPFVGFHIAIAMALAYIFGASILGAIIGTALGSPWTFPFIWMVTYKLGNFVLQIPPQNKINFMPLFHNVKTSIIHMDFEAIAVDIWPIFYPMLIGGFIIFPFAWILVYYPLKHVIAIYQKNRGKRLARRAEMLLKIHEKEAERIEKIKQKQKAKLAKKEAKKLKKMRDSKNM